MRYAALVSNARRIKFAGIEAVSRGEKRRTLSRLVGN
jgi:hypothetical protein